MANKKIQFTIEFEIGSYGWSENYYRNIDDTVPLNDPVIATYARNIAQRRGKLCGTGVNIPIVRVSDIDVRRDASDFSFDYQVNLGATVGDKVTIAPVVDDPALLPNVAIISRLEGANKVYHGQHFFSGIPRKLVGPDQAIVHDAAWDQGYVNFRSYITSSGWCFPCLSREGINADKGVSVINSAGDGLITLKAGETTVGWSTLDRVRLINVKRGSNSGIPIVGPVALLPDTQTFKYSPSTLVGTALAGRKTVAHREETILVPITTMQAESVSHRNRGRPFDSPRGRRKRPKQ